MKPIICLHPLYKVFLQFYLESRNVSSFVHLFELLICDRIKTTLTQACLRHVLSVESATEGGWLSLRQLTDTVDRHVAAHAVSDKPQAFAIRQTKIKLTKGMVIDRPLKLKTHVALARTNPPRFGNGPVRNQENRNEIRRCFNCSSPGHLRINCPLLKREQAGVRRVAVENTSCVTANYGRQYSPNPGMINDGVSGQYDDSTGRPITRRISELGESDVTIIDRGGSESYTQQQQAVTANHSERNPAGDVMNEVGVSFVSPAPAAAAAVNHVPIQHFTTDCDSIGVDNVCRVKSELSPLKYIDVQICGDNSNVIKVTSGLVDSGSEITCVRADLVSELSPVVKGKVMLKPFCGSPITADLICLELRVCTDGTSAMSSEFVHVWCASVPELNDSLILTADTVQRLVNSCHDTCELSDDVIMPLTKVLRVVTHSVAKKRSRSVDDDTNDTLLQTNSDVSDNTGTSLNGSASSILSDDVVSADYLDDCDQSKASYVELINEQQTDPTLRVCFKLAKAERGGFLIKDGLLYRKEHILGQPFLQLVVPSGRRERVLKMVHSICGGHMAATRTKSRIELSFWWPNLLQSCKDFIECCRECRLKARVSFRDRVPIKAIPRSDRVFDHFFIDIVTHRIVVDDTFVPKCLRAYRDPFGMKCSSLGYTH